MNTSRVRERPIALRYTGWALVVAATALLLGGALRQQSNMASSGLLFLALGLVFAPDLFQRGWPLRVGIVALICLGGVLALSS